MIIKIKDNIRMIISPFLLVNNNIGLIIFFYPPFLYYYTPDSVNYKLNQLPEKAVISAYSYFLCRIFRMTQRVIQKSAFCCFFCARYGIMKPSLTDGGVINENNTYRV